MKKLFTVCLKAFLTSLCLMLCLSSNAVNIVGKDTLYSYASNVVGYSRIGALDRIGADASGTPSAQTVIDYTGITIPESLEDKRESITRALDYAASLWGVILWDVKSPKVKVKFEPINNNNVLSQNAVQIVNDFALGNPATVLDYNSLYPSSLMKRIYMDWEEGNLNLSDDAVITFNSNINWYFGTDINSQELSGKYDFVTAVLRELARTFGFGSGVSSTGVRYSAAVSSMINMLYIYDKQLVKYPNQFFEEVFQQPTPVPINSPLSSDRVRVFSTEDDVYIRCYANDSHTSEVSYKIYAPNEFKSKVSLSYFDEDEMDEDSKLMQPVQNIGEACHRIGIKTINVLRTLGWMYREPITVGFNSNPNIYLTSSNIIEGMCLELNTFYTVNLVGADGTFDIRFLKKDGTLSEPLTNIISSSPNSTPSRTFKVTSLVGGDEYARDENGMIRAVITAKGITYINTSPTTGFFAPFESTFNVSLPSKPEKPTLRIKAVEDNYDYWISDVKLGFGSFMANSYTIIKTIPGYFSECYNVDGNTFEKILPNVLMDMDCEISITAHNDNGDSEEKVIYIVGDPYYYLNSPKRSKAYRDPITNEIISLEVAMHTNSAGNDLTLSFTKGKTESVQLELPKVEIINIGTGSTIMQLQNYSSNSAINTSRLPQGVYVVTATDKDGEVYRAKFVKK